MQRQLCGETPPRSNRREPRHTAADYAEFCEQLCALVPQIRRIARGYCQSPADADDLVQLTCEKALTRWRQWSGKAPLKHWLVRILLNSSFDRIRSRSRRRETLSAFEEDVEFPADGPSQQDNVLYMQQVLNAVLRLPTQQREVVCLVALDELSYQQTADALCVPIGTVMSRLARAREALRQDLNASQTLPPLRNRAPARRAAGR